MITCLIKFTLILSCITIHEWHTCRNAQLVKLLKNALNFVLSYSIMYHNSQMAYLLVEGAVGEVLAEDVGAGGEHEARRGGVFTDLGEEKRRMNH